MLPPVAVAAMFLSGSACSDARAAAVSLEDQIPAERESRALADAPIDAYRTELLELAFDAVTKMPIEPHIKSRSRGQEAVVAACLELDQPRRALAYIEKIDNWRRGAAYADLAFYCVQHGDTSEVPYYLEQARRISEDPGDEAELDWRKERIRTKIARTYLLLGEDEHAAELEAGASTVELGRVEAVRVERLDAQAFDERLKEVDPAVAAGDFDHVRSVLESCAQLYDRFFDDHVRRALVAEKIKSSWGKLPVLVRLELLMELTRTALDHEDRGEALQLVKEGRVMLDGAQWTPDARIPLAAKLAELRFRAGDEAKARAEADEALALYRAEGEKIVDIYRADSLRPLAEAYQAMGDTPAAMAIYRKAVEEGNGNPNSRPRAEDLSATCCSMALRGVEPDAELRALISRIEEGLGSPW